MSRHVIYWNQPVDFKPALDVVGCICVCDGEVLLIRRAPHTAFGDSWCFPGGKVEPSDASIASAAKRELEEETAIIVDQSQLTVFKTGYIEFPDVSFCYHLFSIQLAQKPLIHLDDAHSAWRWVTPAEGLALDLIPTEDECLKEFFKQ